jgi:hypothetical protein
MAEVRATKEFIIERVSRYAALAFLLCALPRLGVLWLAAPPEHTFYWEYSSSLLNHGTLGVAGSPDTVVEPLYPGFLATARWLTGDRTTWVLALQILVASAGGILLHRLTRSLTGSLQTAWIATLLYAFDPYLVRQSVGFMEVAVLTALLIGIAWSERLATTRGSVLVGLFTAAAILTRFAMAPLAIVVPFLMARRSSKHALIALTVTVVSVAPSLVRNYGIDRSVAPSRIGINLAVSLSDAAEQLLPIHNNDRLVPLLGEKNDRELLASALAFAREHPWRTLEMKVRNLLHVFNPRLLPYDHEPQTARLREENGRYWIEGGIPRSRWAQWTHGLARAALLVLAIVGVAVRGVRWEDGVLWAVVSTIAVVCTVFYPTTRLTTPMVVALMVWAAEGVRVATGIGAEGAVSNPLRSPNGAGPTRR